MLTKVKATIIENGEKLEITETEARHLWKIRVIYKCRECKCYHIHDRWDMEDIEQELKGQKIQAFGESIKPRRKKVTA
jgi:hypothetical protein